MTVKIKRAYETAVKEDGARILVDRLWPRGMSKSKLKIDGWMKEIAPSDALRKWFGHDPKKWASFQKRYRVELREQGEALSKLRSFARTGTLTLVYGAKDEAHNHALVLKSVL